MKTTYIFFTSDIHKSTHSGSPQFLFTDSDKKKVLNYIGVNMQDYFDGDKEQRNQKFKEFKKLVSYKESISSAINTDLNIYARCEEIKRVSII